MHNNESRISKFLKVKEQSVKEKVKNKKEVVD